MWLCQCQALWQGKVELQLHSSPTLSESERQQDTERDRQGQRGQMNTRTWTQHGALCHHLVHCLSVFRTPVGNFYCPGVLLLMFVLPWLPQRSSRCPRAAGGCRSASVWLFLSQRRLVLYPPDTLWLCRAYREAHLPPPEPQADRQVRLRVRWQTQIRLSTDIQTHRQIVTLRKE